MKNENIGVYTSSKKPKTSHVPNQSKLKQFNSPLSQFIQKHKEYRLKKAQQKDSVELSDLYRDSSLSSNPFTQTVVVHPHDNLFPKEIPFSASKVVKKPKTKRRAKYLTNKAKLTKIPSHLSKKSGIQNSSEIKLVQVDLEKHEENKHKKENIFVQS